MLTNRTVVVGLLVWITTAGSTAVAGDLGRLPFGHQIPCSEAVYYRDTVLIKEYDAITARYADGTAERQRKVAERLNQQLVRLDAQWARTSADLRKRVAAQWVAITLSIAGSVTGEWAASRVTPANQAGVKLLTDRAAAASSAVNTAVTTGQASLSDIALLPVSALVGAAAPQYSLPLAVLSLGLGAINQYDNLADLALEKSTYQGSVDVIKAALQEQASRSVTGQVMRLNAVKNDIDRTCG